MEIPQMSFTRWMVKHTMVDPVHEILCRDKRKLIIDIYNSLGGSQGHYAE